MSEDSAAGTVLLMICWLREPQGHRYRARPVKSPQSHATQSLTDSPTLPYPCSSSSLPELMRVMLQLPQIRESIDELGGFGTGIGDRAARIALDWVDGVSRHDIAVRYF